MRNAMLICTLMGPLGSILAWRRRFRVRPLFLSALPSTSTRCWGSPLQSTKFYSLNDTARLVHSPASHTKIENGTKSRRVRASMKPRRRPGETEISRYTGLRLRISLGLCSEVGWHKECIFFLELGCFLRDFASSKIKRNLRNFVALPERTLYEER